jgi:oxygen-independent coproporphyrinogen-3 oxidase
MADAGYAQYEVSAYAHPDRQCAHNLNYWRFGDYLGIGAGAHGKLSLGSGQEILRRWKLKHPRDYLAAAASPARIGGDEFLTPARRPFDYMLNALRLVEGFRLRDFEARTGVRRAAIAAPLATAFAEGWLAPSPGDADRLLPTELGRRFTNDVVSLFLTD